MKELSTKFDKDGNIDFVGMHTERGKQLVRDRQLDMQASAYALDGERISGKAKMVRDVLAHNGAIGFFLSLPFRIPWLGDRLYEFCALHRDHALRE